MRVLIVDDDPSLLRSAGRWLTGSRMSVDVAATAREGLIAASTRSFDVVILDVMLDAEMDGFEVCSLLRRARVATPVLMLTARDAVPDRVRGLTVGADDYLIKPFAPEELEARVRALARRHLAGRSSMLTLADVSLDTGSGMATVNGIELRLTEKESRLLEFLLTNRAAPAGQLEIFAAVWGYAEAPASNLVDAYVAKLRRKLAHAGSAVTVVAHKRRGYRLAASPESPR